MNLRLLIECEFINDETTVIVRDDELRIFAKGNWYLDTVLAFMSARISSFTWQNDNQVYINLE